MATGEVELIGTIIGTSGTYPGTASPKENAFDGDFTTGFIAPDASGDWLGIDLGSGNHAVVTRWRYAPRGGDVNYATPEVFIHGALCQSSNDQTFGSGVVTLDTIPGDLATEIVVPFASRFEFQERPLSPSGTAYRAYRYLGPNNAYCEVAEVRWFAAAATLAASAKPAKPTILPWGGRFPDGSTMVTFASLTTSASFYYTTDGSTPTTGSTLYTGPFTLTIGAGAKTLKVLAHDASLSTTDSDVSAAIFNPWAVKPREDWYDDRGILVEVHAGDMVWDASRGKYFLYGFSANRYQTGNDIPEYSGIYCYSSTDLLNWHFEAHILDTAGHNALYRSHVRFNASTDKWVLIANVRTAGVSRMAIATSDSPNTGWTWQVTNAAPNGYDFNDFNFFVDDDGTGYLVVNVGTLAILKLFRLNSDWLAVDATDITVIVSGSEGRESPLLFKRGSTYFLIHSKGNYYDDTATYDPRYQYTTDATPLSGWSSEVAPPLAFASDPLGTAYNGQPTAISVLEDGSVMYLSDAWSATELYASRYVWLPMTFPTATSLLIGTPAVWTPSPLVPPTAVSASIDSAGTTLTIVHSKAVTGVENAVAASDYQLTPFRQLGVPSSSDGGITWTMSCSLVTQGTTLTLRYSDGDGFVADLSSNLLLSFSGLSVTNNSTTVGGKGVYPYGCHLIGL